MITFLQQVIRVFFPAKLAEEEKLRPLPFRKVSLIPQAAPAANKGLVIREVKIDGQETVVKFMVDDDNHEWLNLKHTYEFKGNTKDTALTEKEIAKIKENKLNAELAQQIKSLRIGGMSIRDIVKHVPVKSTTTIQKYLKSLE